MASDQGRQVSFGYRDGQSASISFHHGILRRNIDLQDMPDLKPPVTFMDGARNGLTFYKELQSDDGHFATEYGGERLLCYC